MRNRVGWLVVFLVALPGAVAVVSSPAGARSERPDPLLVAAIPARPASALGGSELVRRLTPLDGRTREAVIGAELRNGNVPAFLRQLKPIRLFATREGKTIEAVVWTMPDYLAVGSDEDFVRVPMGLHTAVDVARRFDFTLPTRKIVDAIYRQSDLKLPPRPMRPGSMMSSPSYFWRHHMTIEKQRAGHRHGELVAGHKKDLVVTKRLTSHPRRVAIYGWHRRTGRPIQPLSTVHAASYADYSHGVRLVSTVVYLEGEPRSFYDLLRDERYAALLSSEGIIPEAEHLVRRTTARSSAP